MSMSDIGFIGLGNISKAIIKGIRLNDKKLKISSFIIRKALSKQNPDTIDEPEV